MRFERAYTPLPVCSPARASMLTGLYPHAHGLTENDGRFGGRPALDNSDWLITQSLAQAGYRTGWFGKWHLHQSLDASSFGFEGVSLPDYGYPYATDAYAEYVDKLGITSPNATIELPGESQTETGTRLALCELEQWQDYEAGSAILDGPAQAHEAFFVSKLASDWIASVSDDPFFLRVDPWGPHPPYILGAPFIDSSDAPSDYASPNLDFDLSGRPRHHHDYLKYWNETLGLDPQQWRHMARRATEHAALVEAALSTVIDAVAQAGLLDNTYILFCSDHGDAVGSNGGVGNKGGLMVEETMQIPLAIAGPGISPGSVCNQLVTSMDLAPTVLALCDIAAPHPLHGKSLRGLLVGPDSADQPLRAGLMTQHYGLNEHIVQRGFYQGDHKLIVQADRFVELYDLRQDPSEMNNLAKRQIETPLVKRMSDALSREMLEVGDDGAGGQIAD
jgi:arylsulfatase A-like enzyme